MRKKQGHEANEDKKDTRLTRRTKKGHEAKDEYKKTRG